MSHFSMQYIAHRMCLFYVMINIISQLHAKIAPIILEIPPQSKVVLLESYDPDIHSRPTALHRCKHSQKWRLPHKIATVT